MFQNYKRYCLWLTVSELLLEQVSINLCWVRTYGCRCCYCECSHLLCPHQAAQSPFLCCPPEWFAHTVPADSREGLAPFPFSFPDFTLWKHSFGSIQCPFFHSNPPLVFICGVPVPEVVVMKHCWESKEGFIDSAPSSPASLPTGDGLI